MIHLSATKRNTNVTTAEFANLWVALGLRALARDGVANNRVNILGWGEVFFSMSQLHIR